MKNKSAFILIIVLALLGVLSFLGLTLYTESTNQKNLASNSLGHTKVKLLARSGIELATLKLNGFTQNGPGLLAVPEFSTWEYVDDNDNRCEVSAKDANGQININDGIQAGRFELGGSYDANAIDPWPAPLELASGEKLKSENVSALINLRLRRLLNAYGDAHKFVAELGWPVWRKSDFQGSGGSFGTSFEFTSTAAGDRYKSMPSVDVDGLGLTDPVEIAQKGRGFGDRIIAARPPKGYGNLEDIKLIVDDWGNDWLPEAYVEETTFFEMVQHDLTTLSHEDTQFYRLLREHGEDSDGDGFADFQNDFTNSRIDGMLMLDASPPDFSHHVWRRHSVPLINLNSASEFVKSAVFYAPTNVSYLCEGVVIDNTSFQNSNIHRNLDTRPTLGVGGPSFPSSRMTENGFLWAQPDHDVNVQKNRLMSLRDALNLSQAYEHYSGYYNLPTDSFDRFSQFLRRCGFYESDGNTEVADFERATILQPNSKLTPLGMRLNKDIAYFRQNYLEATLPHILSCTRRIPGFMGGPVSLLSPYVQEGGGQNFLIQTSKVPEDDMVLKNVEDFVFRSHIPKICFLSHGIFNVISSAQILRGGSALQHKIASHIKLFSSELVRSQKDFKRYFESSLSSSQSMIGPELDAYEPCTFLSVVGLKDDPVVRGFDSNHNFAYEFDQSLAKDRGNIEFQDPASDPVVTAIAQPTMKIHSPPAPYSDVQFNQSAFDTLRNAVPAINQTWRVYKTAEEVLTDDADIFGLLADVEGLVGEDGEELLLAGADNSTENINKLLNAYRNLGYSSGDEVMFYLHKLGLLGTSTWAPDFNNGTPTTIGFGKHQWNSYLEGDSKSIFSSGQAASDLSPFGGVFLSSFGHGPRASSFANEFADSLYFRPNVIIPNNPPTDLPYVGTHFSKGAVKLWVRQPSGYQCAFARKSLFHLTLWDYVELMNFDTAVKTDRIRPYHLSLFLEGRTMSASRTIPNQISLEHSYAIAPQMGEVTIQPPLNLQPIPTLIPFTNQPSIYGDPFRLQYRYFMGLPNVLNWIDLEEAGFLTDYFPNQSAIINTGYRHKAIQSVADDKVYEFQPGQWTRVVCNWDFQPKFDNKHQRFCVETHIDLGTAPDNPGDPDEPDKSAVTGVDALPSFDRNQMFAIGEMPSIMTYSSASPMEDFTWTTNAAPSPLIQNGRYVPRNRLNSLVDNIDVQFGFQNAYLNLDGLNAYFDTDLNPGPPDRYDLRQFGRELFFKVEVPKGAKIIQVGVKNYEFIKRAYYEDEYNEQIVNSPELDLNLYDRSSDSNVSAVASKTSVVKLISSNRPMASPRKKYFNSDVSIAPEDAYLRLSYKTQPVGLGASFTDDSINTIPWVTSISYRYKLPRVLHLSWISSN